MINIYYVLCILYLEGSKMRNIFLALSLCYAYAGVQTTYASTYQEQQDNSTLNFSSEYGFQWQLPKPVNYKQFYLIGTQGNQQVAFYETREGQNIGGIEIGQTLDDVLDKHGKPIPYISKNGIKHIQNYVNQYGNTTHGIYLIKNQYVQYLYDNHDHNRVRAIIVINKDIEDKHSKLFGEPTNTFRDGSENLSGHLLNQSRVAHNLSPLVIAHQYKQVARKHSEEMANEDFFGHKNSRGEGSADRMRKINPYLNAGENILHSVTNPMQAHNGFMNSKGHRDNLLTPNFTHSITGVAFKKKAPHEPLYTVNFYTDELKEPQKFLSEYGFEWQLPQKVDYKNFYLKGIDNYEEVAIYETRVGVSFGGVKVGQTLNDVLNKHGRPIDYITRNHVNYRQNYQDASNKTTHGTYLIDEQYITYLYDTQDNNRIRAILVLDQKYENQLLQPYGQPSATLRTANEQLMLHLINQIRAEKKLSALFAIPKQNEIARKHSQEMVNANVYQYNSLAGEDAATRLKKADVQVLAESSSVLRNQRNAIFSVHQLFNQTDDRDILTKPNFTHIIAGVAFNPQNKSDLTTTLHLYQQDEKSAYPNTEIFLSEYGFKWHLQTPADYNNFYLIGMHDHKPVALYETRQGKDVGGIKIGQNFNDVIEKHGKPVSSILRNNSVDYTYSYSANPVHGTYLINGQYVTYLYDSNNNQRVRAAIAVNEDFERDLPGYYANPNPLLAQDAERLLVHLVNQSRTEQQLSPVELAIQSLKTARKYSEDMVERNYYSTQNPEGIRFTQIMKDENIDYNLAEVSVYKTINTSSILRSHHNLINSVVDRKYILNPKYNKMITGISFNKGSNPHLVSTIAYFEEK